MAKFKTIIVPRSRVPAINLFGSWRFRADGGNVVSTCCQNTGGSPATCNPPTFAPFPAFITVLHKQTLLRFCIHACRSYARYITRRTVIEMLDHFPAQYKIYRFCCARASLIVRCYLKLIESVTSIIAFITWSRVELIRRRRVSDTSQRDYWLVILSTLYFLIEKSFLREIQFALSWNNVGGEYNTFFQKSARLIQPSHFLDLPLKGGACPLQLNKFHSHCRLVWHGFLSQEALERRPLSPRSSS